MSNYRIKAEDLLRLATIAATAGVDPTEIIGIIQGAELEEEGAEIVNATIQNMTIQGGPIAVPPAKPEE